MGSSLRLFWAGLSVLALGVASCSSTTVPLGFDGGGGAGGPTDGPKTDGATTDGAKTDGAKSDAIDARGPDLNVPPPAMLTATVLDRRATTFELLWTAPSAGGAAVSGYQVRYAKVPITAANFEDATMTTAVPYTGTPKAPGETDGMIVKAYIENGYYFAVIGTDSGGTNVGTLMATTAAVTAHFNVTTLVSGSTATEALGYSISAEGDLNGDGLSDVLAGTFQGGKAYLFFGSTSVIAAPPSVTFSGTTTGFGLAVEQIGDIDHDGLPDIAISDPLNLKVFIYKGRTAWPMTLADTQADYVISSTDASYTGSLLGISLSRLGDFTGDGVDDLAIGARGFNTNVGRVVIVPGKSSGFASVTLPDPANSIVIDGNSSLGTSTFGYRVLGIGHYYSVTTGTALVASAPGRATAGAGAVYAFHGQTGSSGVVALSSADSIFAGAAGVHPGEILTSLGPLLGSFPAVGLGNPADTASGSGANGTGYLMHGPQPGGPLTNQLTLTLAGATQAGGFIIGGAITGQDVAVSLIGDSTPDVVFGPKTGSAFTIFDGAKLSSKSSPVEAKSSAEVVVPWSVSSGEGEESLIKDINGDGWADFCIGTGVGSVPGSVVVYW